MKKCIVAASLLLLLPAISIAQWQHPLGADDAGSCGRMRTVSMPDVPSTPPPFLKDPMPLSETWDPNIAAFGNNPDGMTVNCFAEDSDHLYIGGDFRDFDTVHSGFVVEYNRKTGQWIGLDGGVGNTVNALAVHDGDLYVGGNFVHAGSQNTVVNYIAMWDGTSWNGLGGGMNGPLNALAFVGDTLYAGGNFTKAGGNSAYGLALWDGANWHEASGGVSAEVLSLLASHDSLFVGGHFNYVGSANNSGLHVYGSAMLQNGNWSALGDGFRANSFALYHDTLWAGGSYYGTGNDDRLVYNIAFWNGGGWQAMQRDTSLGTNGTGGISQLLVVGDTLLALGDFSSVGGVAASSLAMYHVGAWSELAGGLYGVGAAAISFNGKLYVGGRFTKAGSSDAMSIATLSNDRWSSVAHLQFQYVGWQTDEVRTIATTSRYVFIGGNFVTIAGKTCNHVAAYDKQANQWTTLGTGVDGDVYSMAVMGNYLVVGGDFNFAGSIPARHIAMYDMTTGFWSALGQGTVRNAGSITTDGTSIYAALYNPMIAGNFYDYLGQWDGTKWNVFGNGLNAGYIQALAWQGSTLYATGSFTSADDGTAVNGVAKIQAGASWRPLWTGLNGVGYALAVSNDSLYVGGDFTLVNGVADTALAEWNGNDWNAIGGAGFNGPVYALAADGAGGVYAGGNFSEVAQVSRGNLVHWNGHAFVTVGSGVDNTVDALGIDNSALYAGGWFERVGSTPTISLHFAALDGAGAWVKAAGLDNALTLSVYPDPASEASTVSFDLEKPAFVRVELFNAIGSRVALLADSYDSPGQVTLPMDASKLSSGMYFLRLTTDGVVSSRSFVVNRR